MSPLHARATAAGLHARATAAGGPERGVIALDELLVNHVLRQADPGPTDSEPRLLLLEAPWHYGKTFQLNRLLRTLANRGAPYTEIGINSPPPATTAAGMGHFAWQLSRDFGAGKPLRFDRLTAALVATTAPVDDEGDRDKARGQILREWNRYQGYEERLKFLEKMATAVASPVLAGHGVPAAGVGSFIALVEAMWRQVRKKYPPKPLRWFALVQPAAEARGGGAALDVLCDLARDYSRNPEDNHVKKVLAMAFLTDVAEAFRAEKWRRYNAVLLVDDVDRNDLTGLIDVLLQGKKELDRIRANAIRVGRQRKAADTTVPLSIVATAQTEGRGPAAGGPGPRWPRPWSVRRLTPLTHRDITDLAVRCVGQEMAELVAEAVHALTDGHPAASSVLLSPRCWEDADYEPANVLGEPAGPMDKALRAALLPDSAHLEPIITRQLTRCAVAHDRATAQTLLSDRFPADGMTAKSVREMLKVLPLWRARDSRPTLLRRLLLRQLQVPEEGGPGPHEDDWEFLHTWLSKRSEQRHIRAYYLCGEGLFAQAAFELASAVQWEASDRAALEQWLGCVWFAASAPRRAQPVEPTALAQAWALRMAPGDPVAMPLPDSVMCDVQPELLRVTQDLLTTLAVAADPLCGIRRSTLRRGIGQCYLDLDFALRHSERPDLGGVLAKRQEDEERLQGRWVALEAFLPNRALPEEASI